MNSTRRWLVPLRLLMASVLALSLSTPPAASAARGSQAAAHDTLPGSKAAREASQQFIDDAAASNRAEIQSAQFVLQHTRDNAVRQFAQKIVHDHTQALGRLTQLASAEGLELRPGVSSKDAEALERLKQAHGTALDTEYLRTQQQDHTEAVQKFRQAESSTSLLAGVRDYARMTLPHLQEHLRMARQLVASESKSAQAAR